jgi:integrase/recombinase XerD
MKMRQKLQIAWDIPTRDKDSKLKQYKRYLRDQGARQSTIDDYLARVGRYLEFCGKEQPSPDMAQNFRDSLMDRDLSRSTINNTCFAMKKFHKMLGQDVTFPFLKRTNTIPYYFTSDEVSRIFDQINNIKHLAMFKAAFYGCLRASELCNLDMEDVDLSRLSLKVRDGKGGKTAMVYISEDAAVTLHDYMAIRPELDLKRERPLFYTDYGSLYKRTEIHRLVTYYKEKAGITKKGGAHVLFRHTPASLMVQNGCDLLTIQHVLRHNDINTSMRYLHLAEDTKRLKYDKFLKL